MSRRSSLRLGDAPIRSLDGVIGGGVTGESVPRLWYHPRVTDDGAASRGYRAVEILYHAYLTGLILTKLDGSAKGGAVAAIAEQHPLPLKFIGVGEGIDDLRPFNAADFVEALLPDVD